MYKINLSHLYNRHTVKKHLLSINNYWLLLVGANFYIFLMSVFVIGDIRKNKYLTDYIGKNGAHSTVSVELKNLNT
jgi:hypothetical protein